MKRIFTFVAVLVLMLAISAPALAQGNSENAGADKVKVCKYTGTPPGDYSHSIEVSRNSTEARNFADAHDSIVVELDEKCPREDDDGDGDDGGNGDDNGDDGDDGDTTPDPEPEPVVDVNATASSECNGEEFLLTTTLDNTGSDTEQDFVVNANGVEVSLTVPAGEERVLEDSALSDTYYLTVSHGDEVLLTEEFDTDCTVPAEPVDEPEPEPVDEPAPEPEPEPVEEPVDEPVAQETLPVTGPTGLLALLAAGLSMLLGGGFALKR